MEERMKEINLFSLMEELTSLQLKELRSNVNSLFFSDRAKEIIKEMAEYARETKLFKDNKDNYEQFLVDSKNATATAMYNYMLDRILKAPDNIHLKSNIILIMPRLDEIVNGN